MDEIVILANATKQGVEIPIQCLVFKGRAISADIADILFEQAVFMHRDGLVAMEVKEKEYSGIIETEENLQKLIDGRVYKATLLYGAEEENHMQIISACDGYSEVLFLIPWHCLVDPEHAREQPWFLVE